MHRSSRRPRALTTAALIPLVLAAACSGDDDGGGDVAPTSATMTAESLGIFWDVSPDGAWTSTLDSGSELCLYATAGNDATEGTEACFDLGDRRSSAARWSPDAQHIVVVPDMARMLQPDSLISIDLDGTITELTTVDDEDQRDGIPFEAAFLDDDTVMYWTFVRNDDVLTAQFWSIDVDGSNQQLLAEFDDDTTLPFLGLLPLDEKRALIPAGGPGTPDLVEFDIEAGTTRVVASGGRDVRPSSPNPVETAGDIVLIADANRLGDFGRESREGAFWSLLIGDELVPIPDRGFFRTRSAALSPHGKHVAVLEVYIGSDVDGNEGENPGDLRETLEATRVSIATVDSIVAGEPEWFDLTGFAELGTVADYDGLATGVVWTEPDRLWLELQDGLFEVTLGSPN